MPRRQKIKKERRKNIITRKRACRFCVDKELPIDYKLAKQLGGFLTERAKIIPRRLTGNCAYHQRVVVESIKRARLLALLPYTVRHVNV